MTNKPPLDPVTTTMFISTFIVAAIGVPAYALLEGFHWSAWLGFALVLGANGMSITMGYHRLWAHNSYKTHPVIKWMLALFGAAALQNSILIWASGHRTHHRHVDHHDKDPYSASRGLWYSHIGWMLRRYPSGEPDFSNAADLQRDKIVMWQHNHYGSIALAMNFIPALLLGWITGDWVANLLLAGVLRLVVSHHTTFFINSLAHFWGRRPYTQENSARDNDILALFTYGEGYHNFHHIFQNDYRNGVRWWQFDPTKWSIAILSWMGLAKDLRRTPNFKIREAMVSQQLKLAEAKLGATQQAAEWKAYIDSEYQEFLVTLERWKQLQESWYENKRSSLSEAKLQLQSKWEQKAFKTRFKELEYALKLQQQRLQLLNMQLA